MIKAGAWVLVESVVLTASERPDNLPEDTKKTDIKKWVKGCLVHDAEIGQRVKIKTITGRDDEGFLIEQNPYYTVNFGEFIPELLQIGKQAKEIIFGGAK